MVIRPKGKAWRVVLIGLFILALLVTSLQPVFADATVGETVVTLGKDLTPSQRQAVLQEMGVDPNAVTIVEVTNDEEHRYLGNVLPKSAIGRRSISSAKITLEQPGSGVNVETHNITWVSESMYVNALLTAGVKDASVYVTAPMPVSGTAALTGVIKAFEQATNTSISEEQKQVANEEMVRTAQLGEKIGNPDKAAELMLRLKEELAKQGGDLSNEALRQLIINVAGDLNIQLSDQDVAQLTQLLQRIANLPIDWSSVRDQVALVRDNLDQILNAEETRSVLRAFLDFLVALFDAVARLFG